MSCSRWLGSALLAGLLWSAVAGAQPWRYEDAKGRVHYTSNANDLPPALKARVLKAREAAREAREAAPPDAATPSPVRPRPPPRAPRPPPRAALSPVVTERAPDPPGARRALRGPVARGPSPRDRLTELTAKIAEAEALYLRLRRKALEVPSGMAYDARNKAQARLEVLRAEMTALSEK